MYDEYYDRVYVYGTPPAQMPAHLWQPSIQWPNPSLVTIHPNPAPYASAPNPSGGPQVQTPPTTRTGSANGTTNSPYAVMLPQQPAVLSMPGLRAPRASELLAGIAHNPATPLGLF